MRKITINTKYEKYYKDILPYLKKDKNQQYFMIILTLSASIFFAFFAINPTLSTIFKLIKEVNDSKIVESKLDQKVSSLRDLSGAYQNIQKDLPTILEAIPNEPKAPTLVAQIQSVAKNSDTSVTTIIVSPVDLKAPESTSSSSILFELTAKATYENLNKFMTNLTEMRRIISIDSITILKNSAENQNLSLSLKGSAYFKK